MSKKTSKKTNGTNKVETEAVEIPADIDLTKLTVKQLKAMLKEKRGEEIGAKYAESRATKIAKANVYYNDCEEWVEKAQHKLDEAIARRDLAQDKLEKLGKKYHGTFEQADVEVEINNIRKAREASAKKSK